MGYTPVPTVADGDAWTARDMNTYVVANFAAGVPDLAQAKGDLFVGTGVDAAARLAVGTNGHVLTADSAQATGLKWAALPFIDAATAQGQLIAGLAADSVGPTEAAGGSGTSGKVLQANSDWSTGMNWLQYLSVSAGGCSFGSIPASNVYAEIIYNTERHDNGNRYSTSSGAFTVPAGGAGYYLIIASLYLESGTFALNDNVKINLSIETVEEEFMGIVTCHSAAAYGQSVVGWTIHYLDNLWDVYIAGATSSTTGRSITGSNQGQQVCFHRLGG